MGDLNIAQHATSVPAHTTACSFEWPWELISGDELTKIAFFTVDHGAPRARVSPSDRVSIRRDRGSCLFDGRGTDLQSRTDASVASRLHQPWELLGLSQLAFATVAGSTADVT